MIIPLSDDNSDRRTFPVLNIIFIAVNVLVFLLLQGMGANDAFTYAFSCVPQEILTGRDVITAARQVEASGQTFTVPGLGASPTPVHLTLLSSMFMHGGWAHLLGNMLFLWIFGDNLEDRMGRLRYFVFYILCGLLAGLAHVFTVAIFQGDPLIPSLGASGAISGVMGGYLLLFPKRRVTALMLRSVIQIPAIAAIGIWFAFQLVSGLGLLGGDEGGGVAYGAHIGGFLAGFALVKLFVGNSPGESAAQAGN